LAWGEQGFISVLPSGNMYRNTYLVGAGQAVLQRAEGWEAGEALGRAGGGERQHA